MPLFVPYDGTWLTRGRIQYVVERVCMRAGLRAAVPEGALVHTLRRTLALQAVGYGTDVVELRDILGHAWLATTNRYLDANAQRLREVVRAHRHNAPYGRSADGSPRPPSPSPANAAATSGAC